MLEGSPSTDVSVCNQFYASHGRDFLLGATILNSSAKQPEAPRLAAFFRYNNVLIFTRS